MPPLNFLENSVTFPIPSVSNQVKAGEIKTKTDCKSEVTTLDDNRIIEMYFARDERAIEETKTSYGRLIFSVALGILSSVPDSEECENDTYLRAWNSIPPTRPEYFSAYLCKITRNLALNRIRDGKRRLNVDFILDELDGAIPDTGGDITEAMVIRDGLNEFISSLDVTKRRIFLKRYFYMQEVKEIARDMQITAGSVKVTLFRVRRELRDFLEEKGIVI